MLLYGICIGYYKRINAIIRESHKIFGSRVLPKGHFRGGKVVIGV